MEYLFIALFLVVMLGVSWYASRKVKSLDDFHLGGRSVGPWLSALTYGATYFSAVIFVGYAGKLGWGFGMGSVWIGIGNAAIGTWLAWKVMAEKTREMTRRLNVQTMPELFAVRYQSVPMKVFSAIVIFVFLTPYCASVYQGLSMMVESALGIPYYWACIVMAVVTAIYMIAGGYFADTLTAVIQAIFMLVGVIVNNGIVLVDAINQLRAEGKERREAEKKAKAAERAAKKDATGKGGTGARGRRRKSS